MALIGLEEARVPDTLQAFSIAHPTKGRGQNRNSKGWWYLLCWAKEGQREKQVPPLWPKPFMCPHST